MKSGKTKYIKVDIMSCKIADTLYLSVGVGFLTLTCTFLPEHSTTLSF